MNFIESLEWRYATKRIWTLYVCWHLDPGMQLFIKY